MKKYHKYIEKKNFAMKDLEYNDKPTAKKLCNSLYFRVLLFNYSFPNQLHLIKMYVYLLVEVYRH